MYITLLSDLGLHDASVAVAKGVLMQYTSDEIIDISHDIRPFYLPQAAYLLSSAYKKFPEGACHIVLFDIFSEIQPKLILSAHKGHYFLTPDNGVLPAALDQLPEASKLCYSLAPDHSFSDWLHAAGNMVASSSLSDRLLSLPDHPTKQSSILSTPGGNALHCTVTHIDRYGNIVLNFTRKQYEEIGGSHGFRINFSQVEEIDTISDSYADVRPGYKLCRFNSNGFLEICVNKGKADTLFGLDINSAFNDIKITFE